MNWTSEELGVVDLLDNMNLATPTVPELVLVPYTRLLRKSFQKH